MTNEKIIHIRSACLKGGVTIVSQLVKADDAPGYLNYGVAFASPKDTFIKKIGVEIARQRVNDNTLPVHTNRYTNKILLMYIISDILLNRSDLIIPKFAKKLLLNKPIF